MTELEKRKQELSLSAESHKKAIDKSFNTIASKAGETVNNVAIVGGVVLAVLAIYKLSNNRKSKKGSHISDRILKVLKQQISLYVLNEGRTKILKYIDTIDESK